MSTRWERLKKTVRRATSVAAEKAGLMAQMGKVKLAISTIERNISKTESQLGRYVYDLVSKGEAATGEDEEIKRLVGKITSLEADLREKQTQYEELKRQKEAKQEETTEEEECQEPPAEEEQTD